MKHSNERDEVQMSILRCRYKQLQEEHGEMRKHNVKLKEENGNLRRGLDAMIKRFRAICEQSGIDYASIKANASWRSC